MAPTRENGIRRSRRIASQEPENSASLLRCLSPPKRTRKRANTVPFNAAATYDRIVQHYRDASSLSPGRIAKPQPKPVTNKQKTPKFAPFAVFQKIMEDLPNSRSHTQRLTKQQCLDIIDDAAQRQVVSDKKASELETHNVELKTQAEKFKAESVKFKQHAAELEEEVEAATQHNFLRDYQFNSFQQRYRFEQAQNRTPAAQPKPDATQRQPSPSRYDEQASTSPAPASPSQPAPTGSSSPQQAVSQPSTSRISTPFQLGRSLITKTLTGLVSPFIFARKRATEDEIEEPTAKRVRRDEPVVSPNQNNSARAAFSSSSPARPDASSSTPTRHVASLALASSPQAPQTEPPRTQTSRSRLDAPATNARPIKPARSARPSSTQSRQAAPNYTPARQVASSTPSRISAPQTEPSRKRRAPTEDESRTDPESTPRHRSQFLGPSTANRRVPTSLSVISERTERTATPGTPSRRSITAVRRARADRQGSQNPDRPLAYWERESVQPKPLEPNADARFHKLQRLRALQAEIQQLQQDPEVKEMTYEAPASVERPTKRVKVDRLTVIPARRAGESSGTFRVPDIDSDDEISVSEDAVERTNVFEEAAEAAAEAAVKASAATTPGRSPAVDAHNVDQDSLPSSQAPANEKYVWNFPSVGLADPEVEEDPEYLEACGNAFAAGFAAWYARNGGA